ncbi:MAG: transglutaminase-like domain-containing protein [Coriobacteriales bacterium]|nr:transglutaminase-like domain-containing protein [Coriobacteriales bacterium]
MSGVEKKVRKVVAAIAVFLCCTFLVSCALVDDVMGGSELSSAVPVDSEERANPGVPRDNTPQVLVAEQPGSAVLSSNAAVLDYSNAASGYICAASYLGETKVKVIIDSPSGERYQYTVFSADGYITIPLSDGSGVYSVTVYENLYDDQYSPLFSGDVAAELSDELSPFLYPNEVVDFTDGDQAVQLSQQLTENATSDVEAVDQIYMYVVQNISYDYDKAASVAPGYLPNNDDTLATQTGICYDFAMLTASMLRAQRLPTKLDVGYCGQAYHAWIEVYTTDQGWVRKKIEFPGSAWVRMDPTFDSAGKGTGDISQIIGDGQNYQPILYY